MVDVPCEESASMVSHPSLYWRGFGSDENQMCTIPAGYNFGDKVPSWQHSLPDCVFESFTVYPDEKDGQSSESYDEDCDVELSAENSEQHPKSADITTVLEFILPPGRFAKVAILSAFKVSIAFCILLSSLLLISCCFSHFCSLIICHPRSAAQHHSHYLH